MANGIYFVRTRHHYVPYDDWFALARLSGFPVVYEDQMQVGNPHHCYIVTHFAAMNGLQSDKETRARIILWQTEHVPIEDYGAYPGTISAFWHMDAYAAQYTGSKYVPIGSHPGLVPYRPEIAQYDIALMMYLPPRREFMMKALQVKKLSIAPNAWPPERHKVMNRSRSMVHIHQWDHSPQVPGLRFALAAAHRLPIISECVPIPNHYHDAVIFAPYNRLDDVTAHWLQKRNERALWEYAEQLHEKLCIEQTFKSVVEANV